MSFGKNRLYELLPVLYRIRDAEIAQQSQPSGIGSGPLEALIEILSEELVKIEDDLEQLYDDQFIETCAEWVVPYIGELVGARNLMNIPDQNFSQRSEVANTIKYRRRKGTATVIEQLARDVTRLDANVVEFFQRLATTQYMNHLRPKNISISGVKDWRLLEYAKTPFDQMPKTIDVRRIASKRGKYNIPNIGIFLWRIKSYRLTKAPAFQVDTDRYKFDVLGRDVHLYNRPIAEETISQLAGPSNVAMPISPRLFSEDFEDYYGLDKSLVLYINGIPLTAETYNDFFNPFPNPPVTDIQEVVTACYLNDITDNTGAVIGWANTPANKISIDPKLGRIAFPQGLLPGSPPLQVQVMYHYGFTANISGGEYERAASFNPKLITVIKVPEDANTLNDALTQLGNLGGSGVVEITDNEVYSEDLNIQLNQGEVIEIRGANGQRPTLLLNQDINISGSKGSSVTFNGLLIANKGIMVDSDSELSSLSIHHCTFTSDDPSEGGITIESFHTEVQIKKSICKHLRVEEGTRIFIEDSIIDASDKSAFAFSAPFDTDPRPGAKMTVKNSTIIGKVMVTIMEEASNTIFYTEKGGATAERLQEGCVRFSYFPPECRLPRAFQCHPEESEDPNRVKPIFTSLTYGDPGYAQLSERCAEEILKGADDESEMGAFHQLYQPQKLSKLRALLDEYLRFGLEAGIFYAS